MIYAVFRGEFHSEGPVPEETSSAEPFHDIRRTDNERLVGRTQTAAWNISARQHALWKREGATMPK